MANPVDLHALRGPEPAQAVETLIEVAMVDPEAARALVDRLDVYRARALLFEALIAAAPRAEAFRSGFEVARECPGLRHVPIDPIERAEYEWDKQEQAAIAAAEMED